MPQFTQAFSQADINSSLRGILRGVEKESLRVTPNGTLAQTPHPHALGAALTHPHITTDYSEALLEFITEPFSNITDLLKQLDDIHRYTYSALPKGEFLWPNSMPCQLSEDADVPVAQYGNSNSGKMKTVYREGLGHRYGRAMQTIAGVHYNFSLPDTFWQHLQMLCGDTQTLQDFKTAKYFSLIRNFRRQFWLLVQLFGAAPALCHSFVRNRNHSLMPFGADTHSLYTPYATSLRMGDLGYQSNAQKTLKANYNCLNSYIQPLCNAITTSLPEYEIIGLKNQQGHYKQLNTSLLQIENEFYSSIRPKRTAQPGETALQALRLRGVEYVEVRCLDLNPFEPLGMNEEQLHFIDAFLLNCLLQDSPPTTDSEHTEIQANQKRIVYQGRDPALALQREGQTISAKEWADEILTGVSTCATLLDKAYNDNKYTKAQQLQQEKLQDPRLTPAAKILQTMSDTQQTYYRCNKALAEQHQAYFASRPLDEACYQQYKKLAAESHNKQHQIETENEIHFDEYIAQYYAQYNCC